MHITKSIKGKLAFRYCICIVHYVSRGKIIICNSPRHVIFLKIAAHFSSGAIRKLVNKIKLVDEIYWNDNQIVIFDI